MRTRTRLLLAFGGVYLVLSLVTAGVAWYLAHGALQNQAAERASTVAGLAPYMSNEMVRSRMEELTGYRIRILETDQDAPKGTVVVTTDQGQRIAVAYRNAAYRSAEQTILVTTLLVMLAGGGAFGGLAAFFAWREARPIERLAMAARRIGDGDWTQPVPIVGGGELRGLATDLESMRQRLSRLDNENRRAERLATLGTFTATIAHEVRNPLSAVQLTIQLLQRAQPDDQRLITIRDELARLDLIVDELLAYSRGIDVTPVDCELGAVAADCCRMLARQADHADVDLSVTGSAAVSADPDRMRQVLLNLILNAIQAQVGGGAVRVIIQADGVVVEDDGPGVPTERQADLFDAFTTERAGGTGLGLHIAHTIAEAHGATLRYHDGDSGGARFVLAGLAPAGAQVTSSAAVET